MQPVMMHGKMFRLCPIFSRSSVLVGKKLFMYGINKKKKEDKMRQAQESARTLKKI